MKVSDWVAHQLTIGRYSFTLEQISNSLPDKSRLSITAALGRLVAKGVVVSIHKGFYIIVPPHYQQMGVLPPVLFLDSLMDYLQRPYYLSLLSAAALHGAAHQQPQQDYVCTILPSMRPTAKKGIRIRYICKRKFPDSHILQKKTETGYIKVSDALLTCLDLLAYNRNVGGLNRVATVIYELSEEIKTEEIGPDIFDLAAIANIQRLGYLWQNICNRPILADRLYEILKERHPLLKRHKLCTYCKGKSRNIKNRWQIMINFSLEIDL